MVAFPPEDQSRHYEFIDSPGHWRPGSPLIERQSLDLTDEALLRHACSLLCEDVQIRERSSQVLQPDLALRRKSTHLENPLLAASNSSKIDSLSISRNPRPEILVEKGKYDSGVGLEAEYSVDAYSNANFLGYSEDAPSRDLMEERPATATEVDPAPSDSVETKADADTQTNPSLEPTPRLQLGCHDEDKEDSDNPRNSIKWTDISSVLARSSSFSRPQSLQVEATKRSPGGANLAARDSLTSKEAVQSTAPERLLQSMVGAQKKSDQDKSTRALQFPDRSGTRDEKGTAVIIDTDGAERAMTAAEERQRYLDLQRAVMEKMFTGTITATVADSSTIFGSVSGPPYGKPHAIDSQRKSSLDPMFNAQAKTLFTRDHASSSMTRSTQEKRSTIMRKLSIFGLGKRKPGNSSGGTNMVGYSRIVEAS
ncbi:hypothetical protein V8E54_006860 [Elaphomyces granulatus]